MSGTEMRPEIQPMLAELGPAADHFPLFLGDLAIPIVRAFHDFEQWRVRGIPDPHHAQADSEKAIPKAAQGMRGFAKSEIIRASRVCIANIIQRAMTDNPCERAASFRRRPLSTDLYIWSKRRLAQASSSSVL